MCQMCFLLAAKKGGMNIDQTQVEQARPKSRFTADTGTDAPEPADAAPKERKRPLWAQPKPNN